MKRPPFSSGICALPAALALFAASAFGAPTFIPGDQPFGSVPSLALTGFNLSTGTVRTFQVYFDPFSWAGDVVAYPVGTDGRSYVSQRIWNAAAVFATRQACFASDPAPASLTYYDTDRNIVTRNGTANIAFRWPVNPAAPTSTELNASQIAALKAAGTDTDGRNRLNFIRGDRSNEQLQQVLAGDGVTVISSCGVSTGIFRARAGILGDVLHARPVFVGAPPADYTFDAYPTFKANNATRPERVFVGSNDGMVHAFDGTDGSEVWAYIPSMLIGGLNALATTPYTHKYFVDGTMTAGDVNFGTTASPDWRTVIVGGLGAGGQGLFALDVTSADAADETQAKTKILWEITTASPGFGDLGYTYGDPVIARMNTGQWVAIVGNGYLNSGSGHAVLYIIDIKTGALIKSLDTGLAGNGGPNGLSTPTAIDTNFDGSIDRIYAGDIDGNLWKFDVSGATAASWTAPASAFFPTSADLSAGVVRQAILGAPDVAAHPLNGYLVYAATGRLLTAADAADGAVQNYAYGIWDGAPVANTKLLTQTLTEKLAGTQRVRVSSSLPVNWNDASDPAGKPLHKGWRTQLWPTPLPALTPVRTATAGERVIGNGFVRDARYQFATVNPAIMQTLPPNGENWLVELDYLTGGAADKPIFDLNADRLLNDLDRVTVAGVPVSGPTGIPVGVYISAGLLSQPLLANVNAQLSTTLFNNNPYSSPGDQPAAPPPTSSDRGVAGGHFDVDIYYAAAGGKICSYTTGAGSPGTTASGGINFTYAGNKTADPISIKVDGVEILTANNPGNKSAKNLASWITTHITPAFALDWAVTSSNTTVTIKAKVAGTTWNGKVIAVTTSGGVTQTVTTPTAGGTNAVAGVDTFQSCQSKKHFHEYDDIFNVTGVNMLNASDATLDLDNAIPGMGTKFKVILHNQYLNPAVTFSIGGAPFVSVKDFTTSATLELANLPTYNRSTIGTLAYNMPVDAFTPKDWWGDGNTRVGLQPTQTGCVNTEKTGLMGQQLFQPVIPPANGVDGPGTLDYVTPSGARHNGALVFQVIKDTTPDSAIEQNVAGRPEYGWRVKKAEFENYVLAEWTTFWHHPNGNCYSAAGWTKLAPPDTTPSDPKKYKTPAAGSADPGAGTARVEVTSTTTTTTNVGGTKTKVVTTNYSDGSQLIVTTVTTGGVSTTTSQYVPAGGGGTTGGAATNVGQAAGAPATITGYQQTRNSGKLGRVTWHELFRQ